MARIHVLLKMDAYVICGTASSIGICFCSPLQILVLLEKFWNDSHTSADQSSKITLRAFRHLYFQDALTAYYPNKGAIHTSLTRTLEIDSHVCMVAPEEGRWPIDLLSPQLSGSDGISRHICFSQKHYQNQLVRS